MKIQLEFTRGNVAVHGPAKGRAAAAPASSRRSPRRSRLARGLCSKTPWLSQAGGSSWFCFEGIRCKFGHCSAWFCGSFQEKAAVAEEFATHRASHRDRLRTAAVGGSHRLRAVTTHRSFFQRISHIDLHRQPPYADRKEDRARPAAQEGVRSKLKERKKPHRAGNGGGGWLGKPDPPSPGAAPSITPATGSHRLCGCPGGWSCQPEGFPFSTLNLSIWARRKQSSRDKGLGRGTEGLHPPAVTRMPSLLSCSHADLGEAAQGQGKALVGLVLLWRGTGKRGGVAQPSCAGMSCCGPLAAMAIRKGVAGPTRGRARSRWVEVPGTGRTRPTPAAPGRAAWRGAATGAGRSGCGGARRLSPE